jgi:hypothetical protein
MTLDQRIDMVEADGLISKEDRGWLADWARALITDVKMAERERAADIVGKRCSCLLAKDVREALE